MVKSHNQLPTLLYLACVFFVYDVLVMEQTSVANSGLFLPFIPDEKPHSVVVSNEGHFNTADCYHFLVTAPIVNNNTVHNCCIL